MVKVQDQNWNRNVVKPIVENASSDNDAAGITGLVPGVKNSRLRNGLESDRA